MKRLLHKLVHSCYDHDAPLGTKIMAHGKRVFALFPRQSCLEIGIEPGSPRLEVQYTIRRGVLSPEFCHLLPQGRADLSPDSSERLVIALCEYYLEERLGNLGDSKLPCLLVPVEIPTEDRVDICVDGRAFIGGFLPKRTCQRFWDSDCPETGLVLILVGVWQWNGLR